MKTSEQIDQVSKAVSILQGEMNPASKNSINPFFKSKYTSLTQLWDVIREPLSKNNLSVIQDVVSTLNGVSVATRLCHASGQWIEFGPLEIPLVKKDAQSLGSATTYAKRYALSAAIGVVSDEDDDGEKAMARDDKKKQPVITQPIVNQQYINKEQQQEIFDLFESCHSYAAKVLVVYQTIDKIPENMFERVKAGAMKAIGE